MTATRLLDALRTKGVQLTVEGDQLAIDAPKGVLTDDVRQAIRTQKAALLALLAQPAPAHDTPATAPSTQEACTHPEHFPPTATDGPLRQCAACPYCWYVACVCSGVAWKFVWQDGPPLWFCLACGAVYGAAVRVTATHAAACLWRTEAKGRCTCDPVLTVIRDAPAPRGQELETPPAT